MAVTSLLEAEVTGKIIGIFSYSQACIKSLMRVNSNIVQQCTKLLNTLGNSNDVSVTWLKGHNNCLG